MRALLCHFWAQFLGSTSAKADFVYLVNATPPTIFAGSFWNFADIFIKVWRCAWGLAVILRSIFVIFFSQFELSQFWAQLLPKHIDTGYVVNANPPTILAVSFWNFACVFVKVWRCAWDLDVINPQIIFVTVLQFELFPSIRVRRHMVLSSTPICLSDSTSQNCVCSRTWKTFEINLFINLVSHLCPRHTFSDIWIFLTPKGGWGETSVLSRKNNSSCVFFN